MPRIPSLLLLLFVLTFINCERAIEIDEPTIQTLLSIEVEDYLLEGDRGFYYLNAADGSLLAGDEFTNQSSIEIILPYQDTDLSFTFLTSNADINRVKAYSYLDVPIGTSFILSRTAKISSNSANISFMNFPADYKEIVLAKSQYYSPISPGTLADGQEFSWGYNAVNPFVVITTLDANNVPSLQSLDLSDQVTIDLQLSQPMTGLHTVEVFQPNADYGLTLSGLTATDETYRLYYSELTATGENLDLYTPALFDQFDVRLTQTTSNVVYGQRTQGNLPGSFEKFDPTITIGNNSFDAFDINTSDTPSFTHAQWKTADNSITWMVHGSNALSNNSGISTLPESTEIPVDLAASLNDLELQWVQAVAVGTLTYNEVIVDLVEDRIDEQPMILSKSLLVE